MSAYPHDQAFMTPLLLQSAWEPVDAIAGLVEEIEARSATPQEGLRAIAKALGRLGLLGLVGQAVDGGTFESISSRALCLARERFGEISPLADLAFAMQGLGSYALSVGGDEQQRARWMPGVLRGDSIAAYALTEPGAGTDLGSLSATALQDGDAYVLNGEKTFITNADCADIFTVFAVTAPQAERGRVSAFVVPADTEGLEVRPLRVLGGHPIGSISFQGCRVPAAHRLGDEGDGMRLALGTLARFRPTVGAAAVGFAQRALLDSVAYVKRRRQFGAPLADLPAVQARLADMACKLDAARMLVHRAAATADSDASRGEVTRTGSMGKMMATEWAQEIIDHAVQLHGGMGVLEDTHVARLYQEVRSLRIYEGTNDVHKTLIARELLR